MFSSGDSDFVLKSAVCWADAEHAFCRLIHNYSPAYSRVIHKSMGLKYEPSSAAEHFPDGGGEGARVCQGSTMGTSTSEADVVLNSAVCYSHGARPVQLIITMIVGCVLGSCRVALFFITLQPRVE